MKKPREFFTTKLMGTGDKDVWIMSTDNQFITNMFHQEKFKVIEKSHADRLEKANEVLVKGLKEIEGEINDDLTLGYHRYIDDWVKNTLTQAQKIMEGE